MSIAHVARQQRAVDEPGTSPGSTLDRVIDEARRRKSPHLYELMKKFPYVAVPLFKLHDVLLRGDAPFTVAERELIAAYVSGLDACAFCFRGHVAAAELCGVAPEVMDQLLADLDTAPIDERLKPALRYAKKLTLTPARMTQADADAVYAAGWSEVALFEAVGITALFAMMNRPSSTAPASRPATPRRPSARSSGRATPPT